MLSCVAECFSENPILAVCPLVRGFHSTTCARMCCSMLCARMCCSMLTCAIMCCSMLRPSAESHFVCLCRLGGARDRLRMCCSVLQCVVVRCSVLQCVAVCCSVLQRKSDNPRLPVRPWSARL